MAIVILPVLLVGLFAFADTSAKCDPGWFAVGDTCYVVIPMPKNFIEAIALCKTDGFQADMVQLETIHEKMQLVAHMKNTYELIFTGQKFWVGAKGAQSVFLWNSGLPVTYPDFMDGTGQGVGCLAFGTTTLDKYAVVPCTDSNLVICEKSGNSTSSATTTPSG
ncbi:snaclec agglucetin subunit alpha-1-like [Dreissena polymorpha]|uniref:C-type lectin domain-containing protein n=1 Tax=Dreissena polymorpha TaxID=45954 RepID=A0A9D4HQZ8_DREPO|nr:snaclec agglucetin subunit alpha-1-like [Dreissena polymorpha]KAH3727826.1 hypothetical protein DPMN_053771 [Dreissena polymorpha]